MGVSLAFVVDDDIARLLPSQRQATLHLVCLRMLRAVAHQERRDHSLDRDIPVALPALEMSLRLTTDTVIRDLNHRYRNKNKPTDVLAFAQREAPQRWGGNRETQVEGRTIGKDSNVPRSFLLLGDIVISVETARRQCTSPHGVKQLFDELFFLASHGLCHLIGYDHQDDEQESTMNARMASLRAEALRSGRIRPA